MHRFSNQSRNKFVSLPVCLPGEFVTHTQTPIVWKYLNLYVLFLNYFLVWFSTVINYPDVIHNQSKNTLIQTHDLSCEPLIPIAYFVPLIHNFRSSLSVTQKPHWGMSLELWSCFSWLRVIRRTINHAWMKLHASLWGDGGGNVRISRIASAEVQI